MKPITPMLGFAAPSGTGKTTLLIQIIALLREKGLRLGLIKHSHHSFEIDIPGKDSYILRQAGALQILVASTQRTVVIAQHVSQPSWDELLHSFANSSLDLILIEGFKHHRVPKIELHRPNLGYPLLCINDPEIIAVATDAPLRQPTISVPLLDLNNPSAILDFILQWLAAAKC